jgi:hypothetical protein
MAVISSGGRQTQICGTGRPRQAMERAFDHHAKRLVGQLPFSLTGHPSAVGQNPGQTK